MKSKKEIDQKSKEPELLSIQQLAKQLNIPDELIQNHKFLNAFKFFICSVCNNSNNMHSLKHLTHKERIDLKSPSDIQLNKNDMEILSKEIQNL